MKIVNTSALLIIGALISPFSNGQDFGILTGDIPGPAERAIQLANAPASRRIAPPQTLRLSETPTFSGPSAKATEELRQKKLDASRSKSARTAGFYNVAFKRKAFPYATLRSDGAKHVIAADGATVMDKVMDCLPSWNDKVISVRSAIGGFSALLTEKEAEEIRRRDDVESVSLDTAATVTQSPLIWSPDRVNQRNLSLDNTTASYTGAGVHVYVIDSGISSGHSEFSGITISGTGACYIPTSDLNYNASLDTSPFIDRSEGPLNGTTQVLGHGTSVASIIAGQSAGNAKGVTLHSVRWTNTGAGATSQITDCINWVAANFQSPAVANISASTTTGTDSALDAAVQTLINDGVTVVVAAGNQAVNVSTRSPCDVADAITVGGTGVYNSGSGTVTYDSAYASSNYGSGVDINAPASLIYSASTNPTYSYLYFTGTSQAAPAVTAVACHYLQMHPNASPEEVRNSMVINATTGVLSSLASGTPNVLLYTGSSWINADVIVVSGSGSLVGTNISHPNGNYYDQVLLTGTSVTVHADSSQVTRVSWIDENDDIVQVELSGSGNLTIDLENSSGPAYPTKYNQAVSYMKGRAKLTLNGSAENTYVSAFSVGSATATNQSLFISGVTYDAKTDFKSLEFSNSRRIAAMGFGNVIFHGSTGTVGINATGVDVSTYVRVMNIDASGSATAYLKFGDGSALTLYSGRPYIAGGALVQTHGGQIQISNSGFSQLYTAWNTDSFGNTIFASDLAGARLLKPGGSASLFYSTFAQASGGSTYSGYTSY